MILRVKQVNGLSGIPPGGMLVYSGWGDTLSNVLSPVN